MDTYTIVCQYPDWLVVDQDNRVVGIYVDIDYWIAAKIAYDQAYERLRSRCWSCVRGPRQ